jgi:TolB-like protein/Tfp pilus assembly protein PilF
MFPAFLHDQTNGGEAITITMSFYEELKRRNVAKVAVLYVIASWLLLQVTDVLSSLLPVPEWAGSLVVMLLLLGFFPVMIFSWVYELTPEGLKREKDIDRSQSISPETGRKINVLIVVLLVLAIGGLIADRLIPETMPVTDEMDVSEASDAEQLTTEKFAPAPDRSIAVLPFVNMSDDASNEFFSDGISEELLNLLAKIPELRVTSRSSAFAFKGEKIDIPKVAQKLNVAHILEGSVRKAGNRVRITAQLIDARSDTHLWSDSYDRTLDDIFAVQDEIAAEVVTQLKITILGDVPKVEQIDPEAYSLYLQARHVGRLSTAEGWERASALFQQALAINPDYAAAWSGLAAIYVSRANKADLPVEEGYTLAREAATKALLIDPDYATAHAQLGEIAYAYDGDLAAAARHIEHALALDPSDPEIRKIAAGFAGTLGRLNEAIELLDYAIARDPVNAKAHSNLAILYMFAGQLDRAIASFRTALTLSPGSMSFHGLIGRTFLLKGEPEAALEAIQLEQSDWTLLELPMVYYALGQVAKSDAVLVELIEKYEQEAAFNIAAIYAYRSEPDDAFSWLNKAVTENDPGLSEIVSDPLFSNLYDDPRWQLFLERIGRSPTQLAAIEFDVTLSE